MYMYVHIVLTVDVTKIQNRTIYGMNTKWVSFMENFCLTIASWPNFTNTKADITMTFSWLTNNNIMQYA